MAVYYVDAIRGDDGNDGGAPGAAWKTVGRVNAQKLDPGDHVLFRAGTTYYEALVPSDSGTAERPIVFGRYGDGPAPLFKGSVDAAGAKWTETSPGSNVWSAKVWLPNGQQVEQVWLDGVPRYGKVAGARQIDKPNEWAWSDGKLSLWSKTDPGERFSAIECQIEHRLLKILGADHVTVKGLHFTRAGEGVVVYGSSGITLVDLESNRHYTNGLEISGRSSDVSVIGGAYHDNGRVTQWYNRGHGIVFTSGAHDNLVKGAALHGNAEDGVQFGAGSGSANVIARSRLYGNHEDGVDIKGGSQTIRHAYIHDNDAVGINVHDHAGTTFIDDSVVSSRRWGLDVSEWGRVVSTDNVYYSENKSAVHLFDLLGRPSVFKHDSFLTGGPNPAIADESLLRHVFVDILKGRAGAAPDGDGTAALAAGTRLVGDGAQDHLTGGPGDDLLRGAGGRDLVLGGGGSDSLGGGSGSDTVAGGAGDDALAGHSGRDRLLGDAGDDTIAGGAHADLLRGGAGNDLLAGGEGGDRLVGGAGADRLIGGPGDDDFVLAKGHADGDVVVDFDAGDRLEFVSFGPGARLGHVGGDMWRIVDGGHSETFTIRDAGALAGDDYGFL